VTREVAVTRRRIELSPAEWEIMKVIWQNAEPLTVREVRERAYGRNPPAYTTVQTVMNNLVTRKRILRRSKIGPVNVYEAAVSHESVRKRSLDTLVEWLFQGSFGSMASYLVTSGKLSADEIQSLRAILDESRRDDAGRTLARKGEKKA